MIPHRGQFQPGQSGNPRGRPKGRKRKLTDKFVAELMADFDQYGREAIATIRKHRPVEYLRIVHSLVPRGAQIDREALRANIVAALTGEARTA